MSSSELILRPHHGMCIAYFQGHGYSESFTAHMTDLIRCLRASPMQVRLKVGGDDVCSCCPNLVGGVCASCGKVERYDQAVLTACGWEENTQMSAQMFFETVRAVILERGLRPSICGDCQWSELCRVLPENFLTKAEKPLDKTVVDDYNNSCL